MNLLHFNNVQTGHILQIFDDSIHYKLLDPFFPLPILTIFNYFILNIIK